MSDPLRELRLRYHAEKQAAIIEHIDKLDLGEMPEFFAVFLAHVSNAINWHPVE